MNKTYSKSKRDKNSQQSDDEFYLSTQTPKTISINLINQAILFIRQILAYVFIQSTKTRQTCHFHHTAANHSL